MHSSVNTLCLESLTQEETYTFDTCVKVRKKWAEIFIRIIIFQKSSHLSIDLVSVGGVVSTQLLHGKHSNCCVSPLLQFNSFRLQLFLAVPHPQQWLQAIKSQ